MFNRNIFQLLLSGTSTALASASASPSIKDGLSSGPFVPASLVGLAGPNDDKDPVDVMKNILLRMEAQQQQQQQRSNLKPLRNKSTAPLSSRSNNNAFDASADLGVLSHEDDATSVHCPSGYALIGAGNGPYGQQQQPQEEEYGFGTLVFNCLYEECPYEQPVECWDTQRVTNMANAFANLEAFNENIAGWMTSGVTDMTGMFRGASAFNRKISSWDTSRVRSMRSMFEQAVAFDQDLEGWMTSEVTDMANMFHSANAFNGVISSWDISQVRDTSSMFDGAISFDQDLGRWMTSSITDMSRMFYLSPFNQDIGNWKTGSTTDTSMMFMGCRYFDQNLNGWDISQVTSTKSMFSDAPAFNSPLNLWKTSLVGDMRGMFERAESFNQPIGNWDASSATSMYSMFYQARSFDQSLLSWVNAGSAKFDTKKMLLGSGCPCQWDPDPSVAGPWCRDQADTRSAEATEDVDPEALERFQDPVSARILEEISSPPVPAPTPAKVFRGTVPACLSNCVNANDDAVASAFTDALRKEVSASAGLPESQCSVAITNNPACAAGCSGRRNRNLQGDGPGKKDYEVEISFASNVPEEVVPDSTEVITAIVNGADDISAEIALVLPDAVSVVLDDVVVAEIPPDQTQVPIFTSSPVVAPTVAPTKAPKGVKKSKKAKKAKKTTTPTKAPKGVKKSKKAKK